MQTFSDYRAKSFWLEQASAGYVESPALEGLVRADVLVIGGGFTGVSAAYHVKRDQPGLRVVLLEADVIGFGASGRNAGLATTSFGLSFDATALRFGTLQVREAHEYATRAVRYVGELVRAHQLKCDYQYTGFLRVATSPAYVKRIQADLELAQRLGIQGAEWIDAAAVRAQINSPTFLGAWSEPHAALVNPARFVREMKRIALMYGVEIYEHSPVTNLEFDPLARAQTPRGAVEADKLVLATNAFSAQFPQLHARQAPLHTYVLLTEPLKPAQLDAIGWRNRQGLGDARHLPHSCRLTPDNRLLVSGGDAFYYYGNQLGVDHPAHAYEQLERFVALTFPNLLGTRITHRWGGAISATLDAAPAIGHIGRGRRVVYSLGCMGHGLALSSLNGRTLADLVLEKRTDLTAAFFVDRTVLPLPPEPLRFPLARGILGLMRLRDAMSDQ